MNGADCALDQDSHCVQYPQTEKEVNHARMAEGRGDQSPQLNPVNCIVRDVDQHAADPVVDEEVCYHQNAAKYDYRLVQEGNVLPKIGKPLCAVAVAAPLVELLNHQTWHNFTTAPSLSLCLRLRDCVDQRKVIFSQTRVYVKVFSLNNNIGNIKFSSTTDEVSLCST